MRVGQGFLYGAAQPADQLCQRYCSLLQGRYRMDKRIGSEHKILGAIILISLLISARAQLIQVPRISYGRRS